MTKKHFEALANQMAQTRPSKEVHLEYDVWFNDVLAIVNALNALCPRFNPARFIEACETR